MKIALFIAEFSGDGAERVFVNLAKEFILRGDAVDFVVGYVQNPVFLKQLPPRVNVVNLQVPRMAKSIEPLMAYLRRSKPDVLMATLVHSCCVAVLAKILARSRTKIIIREANTVTFDLGKYSFKRTAAMALAVRILYPLSNAIIGVSGGVVNDLKKRLPGAHKKIHLVYSPIITNDMFEQADQKVDHPWFEDEEVPVILTVGRLTPQKGFDVLIKAFSQLRRSMRARLLILGEGELRNELQYLIVNLGLKDDVQLYGFDPNPFRYMARSRLFVLSSGWEGLPGVLIQAMACGCPVVSTDCPSGPSEILKGGKLGKLVPVGDVPALAQAMQETLQDAAVPVGEAELVEYTAGQATENYLRVFDSVRRA